MEFNSTTLLWIGGFILLFWFMMRCCGGMGGDRETCERDARSRRAAEEGERKPAEPERKRE